jgi:hypothetical protein
MAVYNFLPVYKTSYELLLELFRFTKDFNKEYKYTIGESIKKDMMEWYKKVEKSYTRGER